ncbi:glycosyltransferase family 4 protein [Microbacterium xylanilyticum]
MILHVLTPGDHFSPRTGSAIPTVVDGLARAASHVQPPQRQAVVLERSTYPDRYPSADVVEYDGAPYPSLAARGRDAALARLGLPRPAATRAFRPVAEALAGHPPAIVVAHNAPALPWLMRRQPHSVILYAHNDILRSSTRLEIDRLRAVRAIVCVSRDLAERTASRLPSALASRVHVVQNGVDPTAFAPADGAARRERLRVMFVGRMVEEKGPDVLLRAAAASKRDDLEYVLVGSAGFDPDAPLSPYERRLRALAERVSAPVTFRPFVAREELGPLMRSADVFAAPSRWAEPSGLTLGEAMATGLAVITSATGGIPDVVGDTALLTEAGSVDEVAAALDRLAGDPTLRRALGDSARRRALDHDWAWSWRQFASVLDAL